MKKRFHTSVQPPSYNATNSSKSTLTTTSTLTIIKIRPKLFTSVFCYVARVEASATWEPASWLPSPEIVPYTPKDYQVSAPSVFDFWRMREKNRPIPLPSQQHTPSTLPWLLPPSQQQTPTTPTFQCSIMTPNEPLQTSPSPSPQLAGHGRDPTTRSPPKLEDHELGGYALSGPIWDHDSFPPSPFQQYPVLQSPILPYSDDDFGLLEQGLFEHDYHPDPYNFDGCSDDEDIPIFQKSSTSIPFHPPAPNLVMEDDLSLPNQPPPGWPPDIDTDEDDDFDSNFLKYSKQPGFLSKSAIQSMLQKSKDKNDSFM
jgi:hypothetical protein